MAKNILVEEYPDAEKDLIPTDDDNIWMLDTQVYRMEGLGRFYMGLAGEIQIIEAEGLKEYGKKIQQGFHPLDDIHIIHETYYQVGNTSLFIFGRNIS